MDFSMQNKAAEDAKKAQLAQCQTGHEYTKLTTDQGVYVANTADSLKAGTRGPTLLEDFHFREKITHFDHERIPERVVHARGFGVHGFFRVYRPMGEYTMASFLQDPSATTPVFVRFSTVVGSRGSADTVRDVRGFAVKFYTEHGNYDMVGNNIPVFFIQDAIKFPDMVHAIKPEPNNEMPQAASAHDTFWDFVISNPETAHMVMWLMSDRAIPRSFRMMEGFAVNTYRLVNAQGVGRFVKFHWKPMLGVHSLVWDEAQKISGKDPDFHRRDIWNAVESGDYPEYELGIQVIEEKDEFNFDFDILDPTKIWPEELVPVQIIGKMTLNRNVSNFFAETEQVAFCPGNVVPGIDFSNDPLLQGRLFSYVDTQLIRLGGPNFHEIPINQPIAQVHNNQRDGYHRMCIDTGVVAYSANTLQGDSPMPVPGDQGGYIHYAQKVEGQVIRSRSESFINHFGQATLFWNSMSAAEKRHIVEAFQFEVGKVKNKDIRQKVVDMFNMVDGNLANQIAAGIGAMPPSTTPATNDGSAVSPALSQENKVKSPRTRIVAVLLEEGFNYNEAAGLMDLLKNAGVKAETVCSKQGMVTAEDNRQLEAVQTYRTASPVLYDAVFIPGGKKQKTGLEALLEVKQFLTDMFVHCKAIGAVSEAVELLGMIKPVNVVAQPAGFGDPLVNQQGVVTMHGTVDMNAFAMEFINAIAAHRHWSRYGMA
jgi:catalase